MFCKSCGKRIDDDSKFCSFCGTNQRVTIKNIPDTEDDLSNNHEKSVHSPEETKAKEPSMLPKYDLSYERNIDAIFWGIIMFILTFLIVLLEPFTFNSIESAKKIKWGWGVVTLVIRILTTIWVVIIAKRQNRNPESWGLFAFFFPSISLIAIGFLKKLYLETQGKTDK